MGCYVEHRSLRKPTFLPAVYLDKTKLSYFTIVSSPFFFPNACISSSGSNPLDFSICRPPLFEEDGHIAGVCTCQDCEIKSYAVTNVHIHCVLSSQVDGKIVKNPALRPFTRLDSEMMLKRSNLPSKMGMIVGLPTTLQYFFFLSNILRNNARLWESD